MQSSRMMKNPLQPLVALFVFSCVLFSPRNAVAGAKATNISGWILPESGFPVFYRFFRDKTAWYDAQAVCQFHYGNLVTVNNGIQFDATRAFLRELDVEQPVWIGLKGSTGSQFNWADGQPLDNNAGYWAESFPSAESSLCAAIDPARNFRWHALNCNGEATAAFLCEMHVPEWGLNCTGSTIPSLSVQYLSESATISLSRDCGEEEGERHVLCTAGEDQAVVLSKLVCNPSTASASSTDGDIYSTADEALLSTTTLDDDPVTGTSTMDPSINKIVTEIQSIATNDSLNGELEPMKPRKQPKKYSTSLEKKKYSKKAADRIEKEPRIGEPEIPLTTDQTDKSEILKRVKKVSASAGAEDRVRRETLDSPFFFYPNTNDNPAENTPTVEVTTEIIDEALNGTEDFSALKDAKSTGDWLEEMNNVTEIEVESSSPAPPEAGIGQTTTVQPVDHPGTPHSVQPKGALTHPMHISSDMTKEQLEQGPQEPPKAKAKIVLEEDHFVPPMLMVMKSKHSPGKSQENSTQPEEMQHTIERPQVDAANDISKFYPASTQKTPSDEGKVVMDLNAEKSVDNSSAGETTTTSTTTAQAVTTTKDNSGSSTTPQIPTTTTTPPGIELSSADAGEVKPAEPKYHSEFSFTNEENYKPYRPNRRRSLTKPASHSYLRKILG